MKRLVEMIGFVTAAVFTWAAPAGATVRTYVGDAITDDCGYDPAIAASTTTGVVHGVWTCRPNPGPIVGVPPVRVGRLTVATDGTISKTVKTIGFGETPSIASDGSVAFVNTGGYLIYARPVSINAGNCGPSNEYDCETLPVGAANPVGGLSPGAPKDPDVTIYNGKAYVIFRTGRAIQRVRRDGVNSYSTPTVVYDPPEAQFYGDRPRITSPGTGSLWTAHEVHQGLSQWVSAAGGTACSGCSGLDGLQYNDFISNVGALIDDVLYVRSGSTWSANQISATAEFVTGITVQGGSFVVTRGGLGGLRQAMLLGNGTFSSTNVDTSVEVGRSKIAVTRTSIHVFLYYDVVNKQLKLASVT